MQGHESFKEASLPRGAHLLPQQGRRAAGELHLLALVTGESTRRSPLPAKHRQCIGQGRQRPERGQVLGENSVDLGELAGREEVDGRRPPGRSGSNLPAPPRNDPPNVLKRLTQATREEALDAERDAWNGQAVGAKSCLP